MNTASELPIARLNLNDRTLLLRLYQVFRRAYQVEAELLHASVFPPLQRRLEEMVVTGREFVGYWEEEEQQGDVEERRELAAAMELGHSDGVLEICSLVVDPSYFRRGIASRLLAHVLTEYTWRRAIVETATGNTPAIDLYRKFGFRESRRWMSQVGIEKIALEIAR